MTDFLYHGKTMYQAFVTFFFISWKHNVSVLCDNFFISWKLNESSLHDRFFVSWKHNILFCIHIYSVSNKRRKRLKKLRKCNKENKALYTGRQKILSSLVKYVTAEDTILSNYKKWSGQNSYLTSEIIHSSRY